MKPLRSARFARSAPHKNFVFEGLQGLFAGLFVGRSFGGLAAARERGSGGGQRTRLAKRRGARPAVTSEHRQEDEVNANSAARLDSGL